ncbi:MAG: phenylacetic acid degradation bifunctional protein PaaZ [Myxococcota bacterium]
MELQNYVAGRWTRGDDGGQPAVSAVTGRPVSTAGAAGVDYAAMLMHARGVGGPALRALSFPERAKRVKGLGLELLRRKEELYALSAHTGATRRDGWIDIEGGAGTLLSLASKAKRELPDGTTILEGSLERLSKSGAFVGQHVYTSKHGVALHINAFNFPVWGMMEKLATALLAGMPVITKPAPQSAYVAEAAFRILVESELLPEGAIQLLVGLPGDLMADLTSQDLVSFTGSAATAAALKSHPNVVAKSIRFVAEQDSINASVLGPDATPDQPEYELFIDEVVREMTTKAGQKCTAIRRILVPEALLDTVESSLSAKLAAVTVGDPAAEGVRMGSLVSAAQRERTIASVQELMAETRFAYGDLALVDPAGAGARPDAFLAPILLRCDAPGEADGVHRTEAFGPVATLMPYASPADAVTLCNRADGALVVSLFTHDPALAREFTLGVAPFHGRVLVSDRHCARESTGHGSPLPVLTHGGPGRAGGGEELGGIRGVLHYMQRTAIQGSPQMLTQITGRWQAGAVAEDHPVHPFRLRYDELEIGHTFRSKERTISLEDIEHFAAFTGDKFYAHTDEEAAAANPFFPGRVAHGYLILSFAAGLFVDPEPGPVLANYGLERLRFLAPVSPGDAIQVRLTVEGKKPRKSEYGEVTWDVEVTRQDGDVVATYALLTMNAT